VTLQSFTGQETSGTRNRDKGARKESGGEVLTARKPLTDAAAPRRSVCAPGTLAFHGIADRLGEPIPTKEFASMEILWFASNLVLWILFLLVSFLLLGTLRALGLVRWRLEQLEATTPSRLGRSGLKPGKKAPDFILPCTAGDQVALQDCAGRTVLLVFVQAGCGPCRAIVPELNRLANRNGLVILAINNAEPEAARRWTAETGARFPVLIQQGWTVSKRYEVFATPFAFLIDAQGVVSSTGMVSSKQHIRYVLSGQGAKAKNGHAETVTVE
jgi:methylamine dehydrogenase accessory protein MauD